MIDYYLPYKLNYAKWFFISFAKTLSIWLFVTLFVFVSSEHVSTATIHDFILIYFGQVISIKFLIGFAIVMGLTKSEISGPMPDAFFNIDLYVLFDSILFEPIKITTVNRKLIAMLLNNDELANGRKIFVNSATLTKFTDYFTEEKSLFRGLSNGLVGFDRKSISRTNFDSIPNKVDPIKKVLSGLKNEFASQIVHVWISKSTNIVYFELNHNDLTQTPYLYTLSLIMADVASMPFAGYKVVDFIETISDIESDLIQIR